MKARSILICCMLFLSAVNLSAQKHHNSHSGNKTTLLDAGEGNYDIKYLKFNLNVSDTSLHVVGDVSTTAQVVAASMSSYVFELDTLMVIDSAKVDGTLLLTPITHAGFARSMTLPATLSTGTMFTVEIFYHGVPPAGGGFFNGMTHAVSSGGTNMVYTVSDPWVALNWWPTKQSVDDKIDSVDMFVTVPAHVADGSNGVLVNIDSITTPGYWTYHWQTHYPIDYYLISIAVARYTQEKYYHHFAGSSDSMLINNFFIDTTTFYPASKANFDSLGVMIDYFSSLYGRYPFWQEKYGVCYTTLPGGMEHQTMTTIGVPYTYVIAHELTHQWFGDAVSYANWHEVWLSEAFATFDEQLYYTHFWSAAAGLAHRQSLLNSALSRPCGMVYINDTTTSDSLFDQATVYNKGQGVVTMLRYLAPSDSIFFDVLKTYQQTYAYSNANTADLKAIAEAEYGVSLDTFFNQWIYGRGYPIYKVSWNQVGANVIVKLIQTQSCPSYTTHFSTPVELKLHSATVDTFVKVYNSIDTQIYTFNWSPTMTSVVLNPDAWTICKQNGAIVKDTTLLSVGSIQKYDIKIFPNPSKNYWQIEQLPEDTGLVLTDMNGRILWQGNSGKGNAMIPGKELSTGDYLLKLTGNNNSESIKLVHW